MSVKPNDEFHLVVSWSQESGWLITEIEPVSDGYIWNNDKDQWRYPEEEDENEVFRVMSNDFYRNMRPEDVYRHMS
jgi:hypothetical protein